jgi:putative iron-only hydrogenase system regulator
MFPVRAGFMTSRNRAFCSVATFFPCQKQASGYNVSIIETCDEGNICHQGEECRSSSSSLLQLFSLSLFTGDWMDTKVHVVTIVISDVEGAYNPITELLHSYADRIKLRVGYPMPDKKSSVIFLVIELNLDEMGAFSGKLGQLKSVKVKSITLKI